MDERCRSACEVAAFIHGDYCRNLPVNLGDQIAHLLPMQPLQFSTTPHTVSGTICVAVNHDVAKVDDPPALVGVFRVDSQLLLKCLANRDELAFDGGTKLNIALKIFN